MKKKLSIKTGSREIILDITDIVLQNIDTNCNLVNLYLPHSSCGIGTIESGTEEDIFHCLDRILPKDAAYLHQHSSRTFHSRDHIISTLFSTSITIPILDNRLALGVWQRIVIIDTNSDNQIRELIVTSY